TVPFDVGRDSSENQNADRFTTESRTASRGISGPLAVESPDHFDRNTHDVKSYANFLRWNALTTRQS
ncbi:MAG: hypothetical protein P4K83_07075, partial [Terracidiphilus sp.]|nr:hypothetical protein [Terracidiphilus sp.]